MPVNTGTSADLDHEESVLQSLVASVACSQQQVLAVTRRTPGPRPPIWMQNCTNQENCNKPAGSSHDDEISNFRWFIDKHEHLKPHLDKWIFTYLVDLYLCQMYIYSIELCIIITANALIRHCNLSGRAKEIQRQWIKYKLCLSLAFITLYRVYIPFKIYFDNEHFSGCGVFSWL